MDSLLVGGPFAGGQSASRLLARDGNHLNSERGPRVPLGREWAAPVALAPLVGHGRSHRPPLALSAIGYDGHAVKTIEGVEEVLPHRRLVVSDDDQDVGTGAELLASHALDAPGTDAVRRAQVFQW